MLDLKSIFIGSDQSKVLVEFYKKVIGSNPQMEESDWAGWLVGSSFLSIAPHSEVKGTSKEPQRIILNFETENIKEEYERIKGVGAKVVKELYEMEGAPGMWIATFSDPDGNYFQLMTPWKEDK